MHEPILRSALRSLFKTLFGFIGLLIGIVLLTLWIMNSSHSATKTSLKIIPNAEGNKEELKVKGPVLLQIDIHGIIGTGKMDHETIALQLLESRYGQLKGNRVRGLLLHFNTPGGGVFASDDIYQSLLEYKRRYKVPIYAYVDGLCASGGMYIASAADKIYASPVSVIGSVGVVGGPFFNFSELMQKIGVRSLTIKRGKGKDALNPFRSWQEGEDLSHQELIQSMYDRFLDIVTKARPRLQRADLLNTYGAQIFIAPKAEELGYIDGNSTYREALQDLKRAAGISEGESYQVIKLTPPLDYNLFSASSILSSTAIGRLLLQLSMHKVPQTEYFFYLYQPFLHAQENEKPLSP